MEQDKTQSMKNDKTTKLLLDDKSTAAFETKKPIRLKKKKKSISNGKPTRPLSAYNLFYRHERTRWLEDLKHNPDTQQILPKDKFIAMGKHISQRWNELPEENKQKYKEEAAPYYTKFLEEKRRYKVRRSQEGARERENLEEAAQKEAKRTNKSHDTACATDIAARLQAGDAEPSFNHSSVINNHASFRRPDFQNIHALLSRTLGQHQQSNVAQDTLRDFLSGISLNSFTDPRSLQVMDLSNYSFTQQQSHPGLNSNNISQMFLYEQQQNLASSMLARSQQAVHQHQQTEMRTMSDTTWMEDMRRHSLRSTQGTMEGICHEGSLQAFLDLLHRNTPGY